MSDTNQTSENSDQKTAIENAELQKLESIREILFGQNIQEYRKEFEEIRKILKADHDRTTAQIKELTDEFYTKLDATEAQIMERMNAMDAKFQKLIDELSEAKTDRKLLADLFSTISKKLE